jgi:hypothetical protein
VETRAFGKSKRSHDLDFPTVHQPIWLLKIPTLKRRRLATLSKSLLLPGPCSFQLGAGPVQSQHAFIPLKSFAGFTLLFDSTVSDGRRFAKGYDDGRYDHDVDCNQVVDVHLESPVGDESGLSIRYQTPAPAIRHER